ncbi:MAG: hypothetical protein H0W25_12370 [Acidimicrobiia bacterium]|nr:hypothetical protein [Acidimicrobiia bacterium]
MRLGRVQYIDKGPPGRLAPVEHISEEIDDIRRRVDEACRSGGDWEFACWLVNTPSGDSIARAALGAEKRAP